MDDIAKIEMEIDELFATLKNSTIPTVIVEGPDDIVFYRRLEDELRDLNIDVLAAGNKEKVLKLREKVILKNLSFPTIAFIVDKDLWVNYGVPKEYQNNEIIMTNGYSIENDLFIDGDLQSLLTEEELSEFNVDLIKFIKWYALAVDRNVNSRKSKGDEKYSFRHHPNQLLDNSLFYNEETTLIQDEIYPTELYNSIFLDYNNKLRGKSLLALLLRQLAKKKRKVKYGIYQLLEFVASRKGANFQNLVSQLRAKF